MSVRWMEPARAPGFSEGAAGLERAIRATARTPRARPRSLEGRRILDTLQVIRAEYLEMPGLSLTLPQAMRFWGLDETVCRSLLDALVAAGFLTLTGSGQYRRAGGDAQAGGGRPRAVRAD